MLRKPDISTLPTSLKYNYALSFTVTGLLLIAVLQSCASLSKQECLQGDWQGIGERDGTLGRPFSQFDKHAKSCQRVSVVADRALWLKGHRQGARQYCTRANGLIAGNSGQEYNKICELDQEPVFLSAYRLGRHRYYLLKQRRGILRSIEYNQDKISNVNDELAKGEMDKDDARREVDNLVSNNQSLLEDLEDLTWKIARFDQKLEKADFAPLPRP